MPDEIYQRFVERYKNNQLPWDDVLPPPEVIALVPSLISGRAIDLGCGYGRTAIYLAQHGWQADGVDFVPAAVHEAQQRAAAAGVTDHVRFFEGSASSPDMLAPPYDLAIDIGCMHAFSDTQLAEYRNSLKRLLRPGAKYLLFVRLRTEPTPEEESPRGIAKETIEALFADDFSQDRVELGTTEAADQSAWRSAWFWFTRK